MPATTRFVRHLSFIASHVSTRVSRLPSHGPGSPGLEGSRAAHLNVLSGVGVVPESPLTCCPAELPLRTLSQDVAFTAIRVPRWLPTLLRAARLSLAALNYEPPPACLPEHAELLLRLPALIT